ncbi:UdgX family uracil-DNA binding protein [Pararhizobium gei]|uniref:UdgX family uracil-DNA binding protein n=1 Tax=Pararhizobium gei TaxID=1395951 RepID=UPI0023D97BCF|nr:UdgX family uracil-DNA binding protein [Rhizobium gei]
MQTVSLEGKGDLVEWRMAARDLLLAGVPPQEINWRQKDAAALELFPAQTMALPDAINTTQTMTVPKAFLDIAAAAICHSDPGRFQLLYRILWRLQRDRTLLAVRPDVDVVHLHSLEKSVRRDYHKMTAFVRFKEVGQEMMDSRRRFFAWFEPDHHIVARVAPFFQRRFTDMDWVIATPKGIAAWDGKNLKTSTEPGDNPGLTDAADELWRTYFSNIFNPARLKVKAMQAEMPKKYWKNLPEAGLIPGMIAGAQASVVAMAERAASQPPAFHDRLQRTARDGPALPTGVPGALPDSIDALRQQAKSCTRCPLHCKATQTVFGEGPEHAAIMVVGEQPGDQEDLAGRPFVGPAGQVFDAAAKSAGLDRAGLYLTNAVKHFKYEPRGKRRIHQRPNTGEVQQCKWWLKLELDLVKPKLVVAMGATALSALTDGRGKLADLRGRVLDDGEGRSLLVTVHPSYLLRLPDPLKKAEETARFQADIAQATAFGRTG